MKTQTRLLIPLVLLLVHLSAFPIPAQTKQRKTTKPPTVKSPEAAVLQGVDDQQATVAIERLLEQSGQRYTRAGMGVWLIRRTGSNLSFFQLVLSHRAGTLVTEVIVFKANSLKLDEAAPVLLRLADRIDYAKVGLDRDDDVFVRNEARVKNLDVDELINNMEKVAAAADQVFAQVNKFKIK